MILKIKMKMKIKIQMNKLVMKRHMKSNYLNKMKKIKNSIMKKNKSKRLIKNNKLPLNKKI